MIAPWFVISMLYWAGVTSPQPGTFMPGNAICMRNTYEKKAATIPSAMPVNMYWKQMILWSVDSM